MNNARRKEVEKVVYYIEKAKDMLSDILSDEQDAYECMPENLQESMNGTNSMDAQDCMEDAIDSLEGIVSELEFI